MALNDDIVLGEGVAIDSGAASVVMRTGSGAIDAIIMYAVFLFGIIPLMNQLMPSLNQAQGTAVTITTVVGWFIIVPAIVETLTRGLSVGRLAVGLRIVRDDGGPVSARYAFGRALLGFFEVYASLGTIAFATSFMSAKGKRIGDMLVGTYAMRTRGGRSSLPAVTMPFGMAEWAAVADVRRLPDGLALTARLFIARAKDLSPDVRFRLGGELAARIAPFVAPAPPPGTHPETLIAAVLATRRDREYASGLAAGRVNAAEFERLSRLPFGMSDAEN